MWFDSEWECKRWKMLVHMANMGHIQMLSRQRPFRLHCLSLNGKKVKITTYKADFVYVRRGIFIVEDAKGKLTARYKTLRKWMKAEYGITIKESYAKKPETWIIE